MERPRGKGTPWCKEVASGRGNGQEQVSCTSAGMQAVETGIQEQSQADIADAL